ncbi:MAG: c-type cytochrome [Burkholderiaceae bacterium]
MQKRNLIFTLAAGTILLILMGGALVFRTNEGANPNTINPLDEASVSRGKAIYSLHCVSCHGQNLEGQANWRERLPNGRLPAPPHDETGHTWHHPDTVLIDIVKNGLVPGKTAPVGYESDMPAYGKLLSDSDIIAVLAYIKSRWPADALKAQQEVSRQSKD